MNPKVFFSNEYDTLSAHLRKNLFENGSGFSRKLVVVPTDTLKDQLQKKWIGQGQEIVTGVRFVNLNLAIDHMLSLNNSFGTRHQFPRKEQLVFLIEKYLRENESEISFDLKNYLKVSKKRIVDLSDELASIFMFYFLFGDIEQLPKNHWQMKLLMSLKEHFDFPQEILVKQKLGFASHIKMEIHFFGFVEIPIKFLEFILSTAQTWNINFYQFSPSSLYWGDLVSKKKGILFQNHIQLKGISYAEQLELATYLDLDNPIMRECVGAGKKLYEFFNEKSVEIKEDYTTTTRVSTLDTIKADINDLNKPSASTNDRSVQIHVCPNKLREIEVLENNVECLLLNPKYKVSDLVVYAPNISSYEPYIKYVFGDRRSPVGYEIEDVEKSQDDDLLSSIRILLGSDKMNFEPKKIFSILNCKAALQKLEMSQEELQGFQSAVNDAKVHYGYDTTYNSDLPIEKRRGSWMFAIKQWLVSLSVDPTDYHLVPPFEIGTFLDFSSAKNLGSLVKILEEMHDFFYREVEKRMSLNDWAKTFSSLFSKIYSFDALSESDFQFQSIIRALDQMRQLSIATFDFEFPFESVSKRFLNLLQSRGGKQKSIDHRPRLLFKSIKEGSILSSSCKFILGLDEDSFPSKVQVNSLNLLQDRSEKIPAPEMDRYLFLSLVLNTKDQLFLSYSVATEDPESFLKPCSLLEYIQEYPVERQEHSLYPFSKEYFLKNSVARFHADYQCSKIYYGVQKKTPVKEEVIVTDKKVDHLINLKTLIEFSSHPLRYYLKNHLGVFVQDSANEMIDQDEFSLSYLLRSKIIQQSLFDEYENVVKKMKLSGNFPIGVFENVASEEIKTTVLPKIKEMKQFLPKDLYSIEIGKNTKPLVIKNKDNVTREIYGTIPWTTEDTLFLFANHTLADLVKNWPLILSFKILNQKGKFVGFIKDTKRVSIDQIDAYLELQKFLEYFISYQNKPSYLLPDWAKSLLTKNEDSLEKTIKQSFSEYQLFPDRYLHKLHASSKEIISNNEIYKQKELMKQTFKGLVDWHEMV